MKRARMYNFSARRRDEHMHHWEVVGSEGLVTEQPILGCVFCGLIFTPQDYEELKKAFTYNLPTGI